MFIRTLGVILLVIIAVPLIVAFPPLALVGIGGGFVFFRRGRKSASRATRRSGPKSITARKTRRSRASSQNPWFGRVLMWVVGGIALLAVGSTLAQESPGALALFVLLGLALLIWKRKPGRDRSSAKAFAAHPSPTRRSINLPVRSGVEFERHVVGLLKSLDYRSVRHVGGPGDNGIDIIASDRRGRTFLVQCKRFTTGAKVGSVDIQKLIGAVVHQGADGGIFVTTSSYTPAAIKLAQTGRVQIALIDGNDVARLS